MKAMFVVVVVPSLLLKNMAARNINIVDVASHTHFSEEIKSISNKLVVLDFTAVWCGPCQFMVPIFEDLCEKHEKVIFLKIDVDQCQETALLYGVTSMPTYIFIWKELKLDELRGADPIALDRLVSKWAKFAENERKKENIAFARGMECFSDYLENSREVILKSSELLIRYADNVLKNEHNVKYRSIRLDNKTFKEKILPLKGAVQCLMEMGFQEQDDRLVLPMDSSLNSVQALRDALVDEREKLNVLNRPVDCFPPVSTFDPLTNFNPRAQSQSERSFYQRVKSSALTVFVYEDPDMIRYCLSTIPITKLRQEAKEKNRITAVDEKDCLLLLLLNWFKSEFFTWMNQPTCDVCKMATQCTGGCAPNDEDKRWGAGTIENYTCQSCRKNYRFPRYNHPQKLLVTRTGRCGEWANCFSACCRSVGFDTRLISDWTDHVWTEVYSEHQKRWLHCDPCENVCDKPLLYEVGWGKQLTYVMAFSKDEVIDVTWRYSQNHQEVLKRRKEVNENWLVSLWMNMTKELQSKYTIERIKELETRRLTELVGFLATKKAKDEERIGRQSGSMAWRLIRGETGITTKNSVSTELQEKHTFVPTAFELEQGRMKVRYCTATDVYTRGDEATPDKVSTMDGWQNGIWESNGIFRKVENDWKMVYLARQPGVSRGTLAWNFKIVDDSYFIDEIEIKASSTTFENGVVECILESNNLKEEMPDGHLFRTTKFSGTVEVRFIAHFQGGKGDNAWQHAQLFRQKLEDIKASEFDFIISFRKKCD